MKKNRVGMGIGVSSLIIVFVVLAITIFSALTLLTVRQDLNGAKLDARAQELYYAADAEATEKLQALYRIFADDSVEDKVGAAVDSGYRVELVGKPGESEEFGESGGSDEQRASGALKEAEEKGTVRFKWTAQISDNMLLSCAADYSDGGFTVTRWQMITNAAQEEEESNDVPIWDGQFPF